MKLHARIFLAYFAIIGLATYFLLSVIAEQIKPAMRQSAEEVLVDTANLLAEIVAKEFESRDMNDSLFSENIDAFLKRDFKANIFSVTKASSQLRVYITDTNGIVRYHSDTDQFGHLVGKDFSRWNDVYLTLRGQYGARSTNDHPEDDLTSVMYVAAPIKRDGKLIGVLSVGKPGVDVQPFIDKAIDNVHKQGLALIMLSILTGALFSFWLTRSIRTLTQYAQSISDGKLVQLPRIKEVELNLLGQAMKKMRSELEGKNYVENYVHSLTHELKSPVAAISGAAEIVSQNMPSEDFDHFIANISNEAERINALVNRLLALVSIEKQETLHNLQTTNLQTLILQILESKQSRAKEKGVTLSPDLLPISYTCDPLILGQAIDNLIENALDFTPVGGEINVYIRQDKNNIIITVKDNGAGIPDYALDKICDRFYSLPRPDSDKKSTGIGLSFVSQVAKLHQAEFTINNNHAAGVSAVLSLPLIHA